MEPEEIASGIETDEKRKYWLETLSRARETIGLPLDHERPSTYSHQKGSVSFTIRNDVYEDLIALTNRSLLLVYTTAVTALLVCLHKYSGETSIVVGSPVRKPNDGSFERPNALPIAVDIDSRSQARHLLMTVRETLLKAYANQDYPFQHIVRDLQINGVENRCPLFNVAIGLKNIHYPMPDVKNDVMITLSLLGDRLEANIDFNEALFARDSIERFGRHFENLLGETASNREGLICDMRMLSREEQRRILYQWNDTKTGYSEGRCIHQLFEAQAGRTPDAVAVVFENRQITYGELNRRSNRLARHLHARGAGPGSLVPVLMERSAEMVVALLGILKAGAAYLPLDPDYPQERLDSMIEGAQTPVMLTREYLKYEVEALGEEPGLNFESRVSPGHLAYVIYTSGSTGKPKGVMISHRAICNRLLWMQETIPLTPEDRVLQKTPFTFDASVWEFFVPLISGVTVVIAEPGGHKDSAYMVQAIKDHGVTVLQLVPSMLRVFIEEEGLPRCTGLKRIFCGGEALPVDLKERFFGRIDSELHNLYGPTEAAIDGTYWACERDDNRRTVPIGRPISNMKCYVLDERMQPAPVGAGGELHLGGAGLAYGYLDRPDLTAEKFIPHPFSDEPGARLYRTGDLARYLAQGEIEYLGRVDNQVKLRGFRIELGEIESALARHPGISAAVVVAREVKPGDKQLVAYVVAREGVSSGDFKDYVAKYLPDYMVPSAFVMLEELPLMPNGKVDRRALPTYEQAPAEPGTAFVAPRNPIEEVLAGIWVELLGLERISVHENFLELGGHSLLAIQIISRARQAFEVKVPIKSLFEFPTVAGLARAVETAMKTGQSSELSPIRPVSHEGGLPLSFAQRRLWLHCQLDPGTPLYNLPTAIAIAGRLNVAALEQTLSEVVRRHESLRTVFTGVDGQPISHILAPRKISLPVVDLRSLTKSEQQARISQLASIVARQPFDLATGPLVRAVLLQLGEEEHALLFTMHHIISDGWSVGVLINEVKAHYEQFSSGSFSRLPELPIQYADYAYWEREILQGSILEDHLQYWQKQLDGVQPALKLSFARQRSLARSAEGASKSLMIPKGLSEEIKALGKKEGVTLFMTLLAAFKSLLYRYSGQEDIVVSSPTANRERPEVEGLIGFFVNVFPLRTDMSGNPSFRELLHRVRKVTLGAYAHQDVPFEKIVSHLQTERNPGHAPLSQTVFVLQNTPMPEFELPGLSLSYIPVGKETTQQDLYCSIAETPNGLAVGLRYRTSMFDGASIEQFLNHYINLLKEVVSQPDWRVLHIPLDSRKREAAPQRSVVESTYQHQQFIF